MRKLLKNPLPPSRHEAVPSSGDVDQVLPSVVANNDGVDPMRPRGVSADHKLLAEVETVFDPRPASFAGFVAAVAQLSHNAFELLVSGSTRINLLGQSVYEIAFSCAYVYSRCRQMM